MVEAGLVVGGITVVAGILGSVAGAHVAQKFEPKWGSIALLAVPAAFTLPGAVLLVAALAAGNSDCSESGDRESANGGGGESDGSNGSGVGGGGRVGAYALLFAAEACLWTQIAPIAAVNTNAVPARLRARAASLGILVWGSANNISSQFASLQPLRFLALRRLHLLKPRLWL